MSEDERDQWRDVVGELTAEIYALRKRVDLAEAIAVELYDEVHAVWRGRSAMAVAVEAMRRRRS